MLSRDDCDLLDEDLIWGAIIFDEGGLIEEKFVHED